MDTAVPGTVIPVDDRWIDATYRVRSAAGDIDARAKALALEQSVEAPLAAVDDPRVLAEVVARVDDIVPVAPGEFEVRIRIAVETTGYEAGQLLNMLFGNSSLHDDVALLDARIPARVASVRRTALRHRRHPRGDRRPGPAAHRLGAEASRARASAPRGDRTHARPRRHRRREGRPWAR